ncbi:MAG: hypothetical protein O7J95_13230 [Planctomycetota bacterium]|nr:hypothetical protein [Planctomycetota bacterium]
MNTRKTQASGSSCYGVPPRFVPEEGETVVEPPGSGYGYWAGAPGVVRDPGSGMFYLYYRLRTPLTQERGGECRIAASSDGRNFETVWTARKEEFGAGSIEGASILRGPDGVWRLYLSYEVATSYDRCPATWRVDLLEADSPERFDSARARPVLDGPMFGFSFIKDPTAIVVGGEYLVYVSVGMPEQHEVVEDGVIRARGRGWTALCRSPDGVRFHDARIVMSPPQHGWDGFQRRLTSVCYLEPVWVVHYDGATQRADSYDEFCGLAISHDLENFRFLSADGPWVKSAHGTGSIRYLQALLVGDEVHYFYEYTRADLAHELRHSVERI